MHILFIGDIMGRSGRDALAEHLPNLKEEFKPDITIVNGENSAHGVGITVKICDEFFDIGVDVITTGNHVWDQREIIPHVDKEKRLLRPINLPDGTPGNGICEFTMHNGKKAVIINAIARLFMDLYDDPFAAVEKAIKHYTLGRTADIIFIDFHGEATSEKMSFAHHFDGRVTGVIGTHTHIPTADYHVMAGGTAYQTDAGMTGDFDSVIGVKKEIGVKKFLKKVPGERMSPADGEATLCGAIIETDDSTGLARSIKPIRRGGILASA